MFTASDGKNFSNRPPMKQHERSIARMSGKSKASESTDPLMPDHSEGGEESGHDVAREHGNAMEVNISHENGAHHVSSRHEDGHQHESDHDSAEAAHEHGKELAGVGMEEDHEPSMDEDEPEYQ